MKRKVKIGIAAGAVVLLGSVAAVMSNGSRSATEVRVEAVQRHDLIAVVTASGWIRPHRAVDVQADIMGRITELHVREGDVVRRGAVLLRIDPTQYQAATVRAEAAVSEALAREAQARAALIQAERALERARLLAAQDSTLVSRQALEEAETQMRVQQELEKAARYGVAQARAALREAEDRLSKTTIRAPMDGVVTRLNVEEGETAIVGTMNNPGSLLLTVSELSTMEAVVRVDETDVPELELGDSATVEIDAFPRQKFVGRVTEIGHSAVRPPASMLAQGGQAQAVDFEVVITLADPPPALRPDLSATADIVTDTRRAALSIPIIALTVREKSALQPLPQESQEAREAAATLTEAPEEDIEGVFVIRAGKAQFLPVEVGIAGREHFEVLKGLTEKDSVVAGPYEAIRGLEPGKPVRVQKAAPKKAKQQQTEASNE